MEKYKTVENLWWGYIHINGSIQVKRYFDKRDIEEANESSFVNNVINPFSANNREEAIKYMEGQKLLING